MNKALYIDLSNSIDEAEERMKIAPEAKMVEACAFQAQLAGSIPVGSTDINSGMNKDWKVGVYFANNITITGRFYSSPGIRRPFV